jgi:hypothetical protein
MAGTYVNVCMRLPYKTIRQIDILAAESELSRSKMIHKLVETAIHDSYGAVERGYVTPVGVVNKNNIPVTLKNDHRMVL